MASLRQALGWVARRPPVTWLMPLAHRFIPSHQPIGVLTVILDDAGRVLLLDHLTRGADAIGLPGGWLGGAERPEDGLRRELREELGVAVTATRYLLSAPHIDASGHAHGLTLVYLAQIAGKPAPRSWEIARTLWLSLDEAVPRIRPLEATAVRLATSEAASPSTDVQK